MRLMIAALLSVALCACSSGGDSSSTTGSSGATGSSGSSGGTGSNCAIVGTWQGTYSCSELNGVQYTWDIQDGGTAVGHIGSSSTVDQTWSLSGSTMTIADVNDSCTSPGTYTLTFDASCASFDLARISDPCSTRGDCVDGLHVTRVGGP